MAKKKKTLPDLSQSEYDILHVLWKKGKQTVREVHNDLYPISGWAYTTTKTVMDRMAKKRLLARKEFHGIYLYEPKISRPAGLARFVQFFADRVLETDTQSVVAMFAQSGAISPEEIAELEVLLKEEG
jgi:BlaI family transcriptional regulator, penicillinase repressor